MDILSALDALEDQEKKKKAGNARKTPSQSLAEATRQNAGRATRPAPRPRSVPPSRPSSAKPAPTDRLQPSFLPARSVSVYASSTRSGAESGRRISFADPPRPSTRYQVKIATKTDALSSDFPYDSQKLVKYNISVKEWNHFTNELVVAADVHHYSTLSWPFHRNNVIKRIRKDLQYGGDVKKVLKKWNKVVFKDQGFQTWLELPSEEGDEEIGRETAGLNKEEQRKALKEAKRFRVVVSPLGDKGTSIYSRTSSLNKSVSGEGIRAISGRLSPPPAPPLVTGKEKDVDDDDGAEEKDSVREGDDKKDEDDSKDEDDANHEDDSKDVDGVKG